MSSTEQNTEKKIVSLNELLSEKLNKKREERTSKKGKSGKMKFGMQKPGNSGNEHDHSGRFNKYVIE